MSYPACVSGTRPNHSGELAVFRTSLGVGFVFLVIALISGFVALAAFAGIASLPWEGAKSYFLIFLVLAVLAFVVGLVYRHFHRPSFWDR